VSGDACWLIGPGSVPPCHFAGARRPPTPAFSPLPLRPSRRPTLPLSPSPPIGRDFLADHLCLSLAPLGTLTPALCRIPVAPPEDSYRSLTITWGLNPCRAIDVACGSQLHSAPSPVRLSRACFSASLSVTPFSFPEPLCERLVAEHIRIHSPCIWRQLFPQRSQATGRLTLAGRRPHAGLVLYVSLRWAPSPSRQGRPPESSRQYNRQASSSRS
jgi:hypothetical protein